MAWRPRSHIPPPTPPSTPQQTVNSLRGQVSSIDQLSNIPVGVFEGHMNNFRPYQLQKLIPLPWNGVQVSKGSGLRVKGCLILNPHALTLTQQALDSSCALHTTL